MADLTDEQQAAVEHPGSLFVEACPGAGKTRVIAHRFIESSLANRSRRGVAALSFTNVAVDEIQDRCAKYGKEHLTNYPNFIGTFDRFIATYVYLPFRKDRARIRVLDSWSRAGFGPIRKNKCNCPGINPDRELKLVGPDKVEINVSKLDGMNKKVVMADLPGWQAHVQQVYSFWRRRYISCEDVRVHVMEFVRDKDLFERITRILAARFSEIIVDEAQDCDDFDLTFLLSLFGQGTMIFAVADIDQAIYGFRGNDPGKVKKFAEGFERKAIKGNFRSSPAICAFAATLRGAQSVDQPIGPHKDCALPIQVLIHAGKICPDIGKAFRALCVRHGISLKSALVLAHKESHALESLGIEESASSSRGVKLALACDEFKNPDASPAKRLRAVVSAEKIVLALMNESEFDTTPDDIADRLKLDKRYLRRSAVYLLANLPAPRDSKDFGAWVDGARTIMEELQPPDGKQFGKIGSFLPKSAKVQWPFSSESHADLSASPIHQAKGTEHEAILLVLPPGLSKNTKTLFEIWAQRVDDEARRVSYVGATRARKLLAVAVPKKYLEPLKKIMKANAVPIEEIEVSD